MQNIDLKEAMKMAGQDPNGIFALSLKKTIESGQLDSVAQDNGIDLSMFGRPKKKESIPEKIANFTGGKELAQGAGQALASGEVNRLSEETLTKGLEIQNKLIDGIKKAREIGDLEMEDKLKSQLKNIDFGTDIQSGFSDNLVSDREVIGSATQLAGTAAGGYGASKAISATKGLSPFKQLLAAGGVEGFIQGASFGAGDEIKNEDATLGSIGKEALKQGVLGAGIGLTGAGIIGGAGKLASKASGGIDNALDGIESVVAKHPITDTGLTKAEIQAGIRPDIKKSIVGEEAGVKEYQDVARARIADETAKTPDGLLIEKAENAFQKTEDILSDTGSKIGKARAKQGNVKATAEQAQSIMNTFDNEIQSLGLAVNKNGKLVKGKGIVDVSDAELKLLNETRNDILKVKADSKLETIQKAVNKFRNRVNFGKQANEISDVVDGVSRKVSSTASDVNKTILGNEAGANYTKYSEIKDFLKETKNIRKNPQVALRRILSADSSKGLEFAQTIKEITGIDLIKEARFARLAVDTFGDVNPELGTRFRQQVAGSVLDSEKILNSVGGKAGMVGNIIQIIQDIPTAIRNESLLRQGIDPKMVDAEDVAQLILESARGGKNTVEEIVDVLANPSASKPTNILDSKLFRTVFDTDGKIKNLGKTIKDTPNKQGGFVRNPLGKGLKDSLSSRGLKGDKLLDSLDFIEEISDVGANVSSDGIVKVYHRTSKENLQKILDSGKMTASEDAIFFSTKKSGQADGFGDSVLELDIPAEKLEIDDIFSDEAHIKLPIGKAGNFENISQYLKNTK